MLYNGRDDVENLIKEGKKMMRVTFFKKVTLVITFTTLLLAGCGSSSPQVEFYTLNPLIGMQGQVNTAESNQKLSIGVGPVEIPKILDRPQIVTRNGQNKVNIHEYHRWAVRLDKIFARVLAENLSLLLDTDQVALYPWQLDFKPHYRVALEIRHFEGQWGKDVLLEAVWSVSGQQGQQTNSIRESIINAGPLSTEADYEALVAAHNRAIAQLSREIVQEIQNLQSGKN
jgi:uncharacterized lipoprotein YmbA